MEIVKYPETGRVYENYKGGKYLILGIALNKKDDSLNVIYKDINFGTLYAKLLADWDAPVIVDGVTYTRFVLSGNAQ